MKIFINVATVLFVLGYFIFNPDFLLEMEYLYYSIVKKDTVTFNKQCYKLPKNWIVIFSEKINDKILYDIQSKKQEDFILATIFYENKSKLQQLKRFQQLETNNNLFFMYDMSGSNKKKFINYISYIPSKKLIIMGKDTETLKTLALGIQKIDC